MTILTPRQLLAQNKKPTPNGLTLDIDADIVLQDAALSRIYRILLADKSLVGLTVVDTYDRFLGVLPIIALKEYIGKRIRIRGDRGPIDHLDGIPVVHLYRCEGEKEKKHEPHQRISFSLPRCPITGYLMKLAED